MNYFNKRQIRLVEFGEEIYHSGLRHKGLNGSLYEDILIKYLREDVPELTFYKGQIKDGSISSPQYDIIICKKGTEQIEFLHDINPYANIVDSENCLGVIELKKYGNPKMIEEIGNINSAYSSFKNQFPKLQYFFVCFRFKDRKHLHEKNWTTLNKNLIVDEKFCFFGRVEKLNREWELNWLNNITLLEQNKIYFGQYESLINSINNII